MIEQSQDRGYYNVTFIYTNQETVSALEKTQANTTFTTDEALKLNSFYV